MDEPLSHVSGVYGGLVPAASVWDGVSTVNVEGLGSVRG